MKDQIKPIAQSSRVSSLAKIFFLSISLFLIHMTAIADAQQTPLLPATSNLILQLESTSVIASDSNVTQYNDLSGNANNLVVSSTSPKWVSNALGTLPCVRFKKELQTSMTKAFQTTLTYPYTVMTVFKETYEGFQNFGASHTFDGVIYDGSVGAAQTFVAGVCCYPYQFGLAFGNSQVTSVNSIAIPTKATLIMTQVEQAGRLPQIYFNGGPVEIFWAQDSTNRVPLDGFTLGRPGLGYGGTDLYSSFDHYFTFIWTKALSQNEIQQATNYVVYKMSNAGVANNIIQIGNSIMAGATNTHMAATLASQMVTGLPSSKPSIFAPHIRSGINMQYIIPPDTLPSVMTLETTQVIPALIPSMNNIVVVWEGTNYMAGYVREGIGTEYYSLLLNYVSILRAAMPNVKIITAPILPRTLVGGVTPNTIFENERMIVNNLVLNSSGVFDGIADFSTDARFYSSGAQTNTQYFSDAVHLTDAGAAALATYFKEVINSLLIDNAYLKTVEVQATTPKSFALMQNYPNPFNPSTLISYALPQAGNVTLKVYDVLGREVAVLVNEQKPAGNYTASFDASKCSSGMYFYRIKAGNFVQTKKMLLVK